MPLEVTQVIPITARINEDTSIRLIGTDFSSPATVQVDEDGTLVDCTNVNVSHAQEVTCLVPGTISSGSHDIVVESNAQTFTFTNGIIVTESFPDFPFAGQTFEVIQNRMLQRLPDGSDVREGSTYWDILAPVGIEISQVYSSMAEAIELSLITESVGVFLDLKAIEYGLTRVKAQKATTDITFTVSAATTIPAGTRVSNQIIPGETIIEFETDEDLMLNAAGSGTISATAVISGNSGNIVANSITNLVSTVGNITAVDNTIASSGGRDREEDDVFRSRILREAQLPSRGGNKADYERWAREASRLVHKVGIFSLKSGAGTVKVSVLGANNALLSSDTVTVIQNYISPVARSGEGKSPIGALVTVENATLVDINVAVDITIGSGFTSSVIVDVVEENITGYFNALDIGQDVDYFDLGIIIKNTEGVHTFTALTIQEGSMTAVSENIVMDDDEKASIDTITIT